MKRPKLDRWADSKQPVFPSTRTVNCRHVDTELRKGAYGKVLSAGREEPKTVGTFAAMEKGLAKQYGNQQACRFCGRWGTSGRGVCLRCEVNYAHLLHLL